MLAGYSGSDQRRDFVDEDEEEFIEINVQMEDKPVNMRETEPCLCEPKAKSSPHAKGNESQNEIIEDVKIEVKEVP